jgi:hypothetical protein
MVGAELHLCTTSTLFWIGQRAISGRHFDEHSWDSRKIRTN